MRRHPARLLALLAVAVFLGACIRPVRPLGVDLDFEHYRLDNGLEVILREDNRVPVVSVNVWYSVGPANEVEGRRGMAHLFEHMMLQGSGHAPGDYFTRLQAIGATGVNGSTDLDRTSFLQDVPSDQLELALWAESDRMGFLLDAVDAPTLYNQQAVIRNERRERVDNAPYGLAQEEVYRHLFPADHPYHHHIFGSHAEIQSVELEDVREFFRRYYGPNNASLAIVGNIDIDRTRELVDKYFGTIPSGPEVPEAPVEVPRPGEVRRVEVTDAVELPRVYLAWVSPEAYGEGDAEASLAARMLGGGKASRLFRDLVHDLQIAQSVTAGHRSLSHGSVFQITATAKPGHTPQELETAIRLVLKRMAEEGPGEQELKAAKTSHRAAVIKSLEPSDTVADRLNAYNHFVGTPDYLDKDLRRFDAVTREAVRDFVAGYLVPQRGVVVAVNPGPKMVVDDPAPPPPPPAVEAGPPPPSEQPWRYEVPTATEPPASRLPVPGTFRLDNGLTVYLVTRADLPLFTVQLTARSGSAHDPRDLPGLASFTSAMLNEGAGDRGAIEIANAVTALGSTLETGSSREASWVVAQGLRRNLDATMQVMSDVVLRPTFPPEEIGRIRSERLAELQQQRSQPMTTAFKVMWQEQYGEDHPYGRLTTGTEAAVRSITQDDVVRSYNRTFSPRNAALIITGDLSHRQARSLAEEFFGTWEGGVPRAVDFPAPRPGPDRVLLVDRPDAPQTSLVLAQPGVARDDPEFDRLLIVNKILGDLFSSRLNQKLREVHGFTYGVNSQITQSPVPGVLYVTMSVDRQQTGAAVAEALSEIRNLKESGISAAELEQARRSILRSLPSLYRTNGSVAGTVAHLWALSLPQDYFLGMEDRLADVTVESAGETTRRFLLPELTKVIAVGDAAAVEPQLSGLGLGAVSRRSADS